MKTRNSYKYQYLHGWQLEIVRDFDNFNFVLMGKRRNINQSGKNEKRSTWKKTDIKHNEDAIPNL